MSPRSRYDAVDDGAPPALRQPGAVPPRLPDAGARAGGTHRPAPAGATEVRRHRHPEPRRVLPGPSRRADEPGRQRGGHAEPGWAHRHPAARRHRRAGHRALLPHRHAVLQGAGSATRRSRNPPDRLRRTGGRRDRRAPGPVRAADLPGAHAPRRRPGAPVPVHLQPVPQPGGGGARPGHRPGAVRQAQGAAADPSLLPSRQQPVRPRRAGDRRQLPPALSGPLGGRHVRLPGHPDRRAGGRGGGGRRPAPGDRLAAAVPATHRRGHTPRGRGGLTRADGRAPPPRVAARPRRGLPPGRLARPRRPLVALRPRPARSEGEPVGAHHQREAAPRRRGEGPDVRRHPQRRRAGPLSRTSRSPRPQGPSSPRPPRTRKSSPSSRPSTAPGHRRTPPSAARRPWCGR